MIGFDGTVRRTLDVTAAITEGEEVRGLRWSADGSRLAVVTVQQLEEAFVTQVWLLDRESGDAQLAYSLSFDATHWARGATAAEGAGAIWTAGSWGWSPDGQSLLLDVYVSQTGADVVVLHLQPDGATEPVIAHTVYRSNRHFDWAGNVAWSPDGTRIAVRTHQSITEISAEDGRVIAQHPHLNGWLIWPARQG